MKYFLISFIYICCEKTGKMPTSLVSFFFPFSSDKKCLQPSFYYYFFGQIFFYYLLHTYFSKGSKERFLLTVLPSVLPILWALILNFVTECDKDGLFYDVFRFISSSHPNASKPVAQHFSLFNPLNSISRFAVSSPRPNH